MADDEDKPFTEAGKQARQWARNFKLRAVGDALGEWAKKARDLVVEVSENVGVPEAVRDATEQARAMRVAGEAARARALLRELIDAYGEEPPLINALALTAAHERFVDDRVPGGIEVLRELADRQIAKDKGDKIGAMALVEAAEALRGANQPERTLDLLRRGKRGLERLSSQDLLEARLLAHLIAASAHRRLGEQERAIREVRKAAAALPPGAGEGLRRLTLALGVDQLLADGRVVEAERWLNNTHQRRITEAREAHARASQPSPSDDPGTDADEPNTQPAQPGPTQTESEILRDRAQDSPEDLEPPPEEGSYTPLERALLARVMAARGERSQALALLAEIPSGGSDLLAEARVRVLLCVGDPAAACEEALVHLQRKVSDPERLRLWALAELRRWRADTRARALASTSPPGVIPSLIQALEGAPEHARAAQARELAFIALLLEDFSGPVLQALEAVRAAHRDALDVLGAELRLHELRAALATAIAEGRGADTLDPSVRRRFSAGPPFTLEARPELEIRLGPDEVSPLRDPLRREALVAAQRELAIAERTSLEGPKALDAVERALVAALILDPELPAARERLTALTRPSVGERLEDLLAAATELLAKLPDELLGAPITGGPEALHAVIAARERLARPLTIAIMGEFSAGKSTFVNALLGEAVAPMGVLPTTNTINVFRRGTGRGARVHYRDGSISTVSADELDAYLRTLDGPEADRVRHLEIDRVGERMGDAAVVDTPGLNALDAYHEQVARAFIEEADAVVWIFSATQGGTATEAGILGELREGGRKVLGVLNKVDTLDSIADQEELAEYLRGQLGEVLVEVLPLSATAALAHRTGTPAAEDPFAGIDDALERHFLRHARTLKAELIRRRLREALTQAKFGVAAAAAELEARGAEDDLATALERASVALTGLSERLHTALLGLDDVLAREALALGVVEAGGGLRRKPDAQDCEYLEAVIAEAATRALQDQLGALYVEHEVLANLLLTRLVPWARGYLVGLDAREFTRGLIETHGRSASHGEQALRDGLRAGLRPLADDWRVACRELLRELERALARARQQSTSAPRAEALRLRTSVLVAIDGLLALC